MQDKKRLYIYAILTSIILILGYIANAIRAIRSDNNDWHTWPGYKQLYRYKQEHNIYTWLLISWMSHGYVRQCQTKWFSYCPIGVMDYWTAWLDWVQSIQYAGGYVSMQMPHRLLAILYRTSPYKPDRAASYILGATLGPAAASLSWESWASTSYTNTHILWDEWLQNICDNKKIAYIQTLSYTGWLSAYAARDVRMINPCTDYRLANMLGFVSMNHLQDSNLAYKYYLIAASHTGTPTITQSMPALVYQQLGDHRTSFYLRYDQIMQPTPDIDGRRPQQIRKCMESLVRFVIGE
jgi:hypothetical protein